MATLRPSKPSSCSKRASTSRRSSSTAPSTRGAVADVSAVTGIVQGLGTECIGVSRSPVRDAVEALMEFPRTRRA